MAKPPNFLFVMADQLSALALPAYGNPVVRTPHVDALAAEGTVFENAYCTVPICAPSRASMLTGQLPSRIGAWDNAAELPASVPTFLHYLRALGYFTCLSGKMHFIGPDQLHGYEERLTTDIYPADFSWTPDWSRDPPAAGSSMSMRGVVEAGVCRRSLQIDYDDDVQHQAVQKLYDLARDAERRPFFLTVSFTHPHNPFTTTQAYWDRYDHAGIDMPAVPPIPFDERDPHSRRLYWLTRMDEHDVSDAHVRNARHAYYGMASYVDDKLGRLLATLDDTGLAQDTVVVFTSDHGEMLGERGMWYKMCFFEPSARVPLIIRLPQDRTARRVSRNVSLLDLFPTFLDLAGGGQPPRPAEPIDGHSLAPLLRGEPVDRPDEVVGEYTADGAVAPCFMLRKGRFKYIWCEADGGLLFDLARDPREERDLAGDPEFADVERDLLAALHARWDVAAIHRAVLASQRRRLFLHAVGPAASWDYQPHKDAAQQYVRSGKSPTLAKARARFPYVAPAPPDHPRGE